MKFNERTTFIELHRGFAQSQTVNPPPETVNGFAGEVLVDGAKPTFDLLSWVKEGLRVTLSEEIHVRKVLCSSYSPQLHI